VIILPGFLPVYRQTAALGFRTSQGRPRSRRKAVGARGGPGHRNGSRPGKRARTLFAEGLAGIEEVEMVVAVLTLLTVTLVLVAEVAWIVRA
jgi:hypothetical protein